MSLIPSANRWALRSNPNWLDFPDLSSNIARNHARTVDRVSAAFNMAQARLWSNCEAAEYDQADVVSAVLVGLFADGKQSGLVAHPSRRVARPGATPTRRHRRRKPGWHTE